jgi:hypothetical protein
MSHTPILSQCRADFDGLRHLAMAGGAFLFRGVVPAKASTALYRAGVRALARFFFECVSEFHSVECALLGHQFP